MSEKNNVQDFLEMSISGPPVIKPEERKKYLGTLRERIYLAMTIEEMQLATSLNLLSKEFARHTDGKLLLNATLSSNLLQKYMHAAEASHCTFTLITQNATSDLDSIGLVYATDHAVNEKEITITAKYPAEPASLKEVKKPKQSWLSKLFKTT